MKLVVVAAAFVRIESDGVWVLLLRRAAHKSGAGEWEFPGGKVEPHEGPVQALKRELKEELGIEAVVGASLGKKLFSKAQQQIELEVFLCSMSQKTEAEIAAKIDSGSDHDHMQWVLLSEWPDFLQEHFISEADRPFLEVLERWHF